MTRALDYFRNREWVATVAVLTVIVGRIEDSAEWLTSVLEGINLDGSESISQVLIVLVGAVFARGGVNSNDTLDEASGS